MQQATSIRILERDSNRRGDLFGRLMGDLFVALGYEQPRLNIHKSGRELDLSADHRLEPRRVVAECKATAKPSGGEDLNKFVGAIDAEQDKHPITGYFISLAGFTETALEQEKQRRTKIVPLTGPDVVKGLVDGRILISKDRATEVAGRHCGALDHLVLDPEAELLAHARGWIWAVYYTQGKTRSHFALIHSDGTPLSKSLADEIVAADRTCGGVLHNLSCLNRALVSGADSDPGISDALEAYRQYILNECGFIQLDGLPADHDVGSRRLRLENLFVPLHVDLMKPQSDRTEQHQPVGTVLSEHPRLALLAPPGGGKSTLLKRLAVAYADPMRREQIADKLPERDWVPLFFRCRELRSQARESFAELLEALSHREPVRQHATIFRAYVDRAIHAGRILLLVDGLDEISDPGDRAAFVCTLRASLLAYPGTAMVVTSREAGFRHVAAHLASICTKATLSPFDELDVRELAVAWHREVIGDTEKVRIDAEQLATTILLNDRIKRLAVNPLLLTTLFLVKRWVGSLPTRRAVLYGKAVEVLLMTWNTEGHEPMPEEEALPQLCYVASAMLLEGVQKISRPRLASLIQEARDALPTELGYVQGSVDQFIRRVEDRSSLLMMSGYDIEDGQLVEFFEFRHLTFQEFLTARALVDGWHRGRKASDTVATVLEPYLNVEEWGEVIPLAAVLGGKAAEALIQRLTDKVSHIDHRENVRGGPTVVALVNCLADDAAARPNTIQAAATELVRFGSALSDIPSVVMLVRGRYGADFRLAAGKAFISATPDVGCTGEALLTTVWWQMLESEDSQGYALAAEKFIKMLNTTNELSRCEGAMGVGRLCYELCNERSQYRSVCEESLRCAGPTLLDMLFKGTSAEYSSALFALGPLCGSGIWTAPSDANIVGRMFRLWREARDDISRHIAARSLALLPLLSRDRGREAVSLSGVDFLPMLILYDQLDKVEKAAALVVAWYLRALSDEDLARRAHMCLSTQANEDSRDKTLRKVLELVRSTELSQCDRS